MRWTCVVLTEVAQYLFNGLSWNFVPVFMVLSPDNFCDLWSSIEHHQVKIWNCPIRWSRSKYCTVCKTITMLSERGVMRGVKGLCLDWNQGLCSSIHPWRSGFEACNGCIITWNLCPHQKKPKQETQRNATQRNAYLEKEKKFFSTF